MRLIDADELKNCYTGHNGLDDKASYESIRKMIDNQPTAYDIDKVVEELEELREKEVCDYLDCKCCSYTNICGVETDQSNNVKWDKAIEIVKQGGVESDDVCHCPRDCPYYMNGSECKADKCIIEIVNERSVKHDG